MLNAVGLPTGRTKERAAVHRDGDLHRTLHVWLVKDARSVLLQRRAASKDLEPGKWVKIVKWVGADEAKTLIRQAMERAKKA